ncbi:hypothetical protein Fcan01_14060 [Folsomia candida]|uniref:F-box domain-containing protein n=1 Tax=Folsomia candida TaxID=158441 RepID=A0A226E200_FOLCA|nr:hypothetical protein Fcan01_14060 [Folsomia candida]
MSDPQLPTSYDELLAKYKQLLEENSTLKNLVNSSRSENALVTREDQSVTILDVSAPLGTVEPVPTSPHPFLLEPILRHLSVFLDYASLHACRQVCSSWYIFMTTAFLKRSKIVMQFNRDVRPVPQRRLPRTPIPGPLQPPQQEDALWLDSSDSDEEFLHGWRTIDNLGKVYPYPIVTEAELALKEITRPEGSSTFRQLRKFYWESKARLCSSQSELIPSKINATEEEEDTNEDAILSFDLGLNFDKDLHIPSPPVPETLELVGFNCPSGWLKTYGYLVKNLSIDFGNFQRRERFGEVEPSVLVRLLKEFCPNVDSLVVQKPTYNLGQSLVRGEDGGPSQDVLLPVVG